MDAEVHDLVDLLLGLAGPVNLSVEHEQVATFTAREHVLSEPTGKTVISASAVKAVHRIVAGHSIDEGIACQVDGVLAKGSHEFDRSFCRETVGDVRLHGIGSIADGFDDDVLRMVDNIDVTTGSALKCINACPSVEDIEFRIADEMIPTRPAGQAVCRAAIGELQDFDIVEDVMLKSRETIAVSMPPAAPASSSTRSPA